jgi:hypothetical protein
VIGDLPASYRLNVPRLNLLSSPEVRQPGKAPNYSVNWTSGSDQPEIIDAMKGKDQVIIEKSHNFYYVTFEVKYYLQFRNFLFGDSRLGFLILFITIKSCSVVLFLAGERHSLKASQGFVFPSLPEVGQFY